MPTFQILRVKLAALRLTPIWLEDEDVRSLPNEVLDAHQRGETARDLRRLIAIWCFFWVHVSSVLILKKGLCWSMPQKNKFLLRLIRTIGVSHELKVPFISCSPQVIQIPALWTLELVGTIPSCQVTKSSAIFILRSFTFPWPILVSPCPAFARRCRPSRRTSPSCCFCGEWCRSRCAGIGPQRQRSREPRDRGPARWFCPPAYRPMACAPRPAANDTMKTMRVRPWRVRRRHPSRWEGVSKIFKNESLPFFTYP